MTLLRYEGDYKYIQCKCSRWNCTPWFDNANFAFCERCCLTYVICAKCESSQVDLIFRDLASPKNINHVCVYYTCNRCGITKSYTRIELSDWAGVYEYSLVQSAHRSKCGLCYKK